jgi:hypothetical protein
MYAVVSGDVQVATLQWDRDSPSSFSAAFRKLMDAEGSGYYDTYALSDLAVDLYSRRYAVLESDTFELKFVRLLWPELESI